MSYEFTKGVSVPIKSWTKGVEFEDQAKEQLLDLSKMPFLHKHIAVMPDVHLGKGCSIGSVVATKGAIIPSAVGVDIGCGMSAVKTSLRAPDLPDSLTGVRFSLEASIPTGSGKWNLHNLPDDVVSGFSALKDSASLISAKDKRIKESNQIAHLGTLGGGNHFVEVCIDEEQYVWIMLHSGSRGVGNAIGRTYIEKAKKEMEKWIINLPNEDLAYLPEGSEYYGDYLYAVSWAQEFARVNRDVMMNRAVKCLEDAISKEFILVNSAVNCHHNYVATENHYGANVLVTRKGAVRARKGDLGIIPGSMGAKSFIVKGLGNPESFCSCSHGAGRVMSRKKAKELVSQEEHLNSLKGVECNNTTDTLDETPNAYKDIDSVIKAQEDLIEVVHTLKQVVCIKG